MGGILLPLSLYSTYCVHSILVYTGRGYHEWYTTPS